MNHHVLYINYSPQFDLTVPHQSYADAFTSFLNYTINYLKLQEGNWTLSIHQLVGG